MKEERAIAYFSMEIGLEDAIPTYSGGLGILAGDTIRSAADMRVPMVAVTLLHRKGYFYQKLDPHGWQVEEEVQWVPEDFLELQEPKISVEIEGRTVLVQAWKYKVPGQGGYQVPVYLLDSDLPENSHWDRTLTHHLYGGDLHYRICQEVILGIGGVRILRALGHKNIERFHMNEGHAGFLALELLDERAQAKGREFPVMDDVEWVRKKCVFTTHTPVPAGHDQFSMDLVEKVLGHREVFNMQDIFCCEGRLNMTYLALNLSHFVNGVAKKHGEVSRLMFARYQIDSITNGVHAVTWASRPFQNLFDLYIPGWREDNFSLRYALSIPPQVVQNAHREAKALLIRAVNHQTNIGMDVDVFTLGFARRAAPYKRAELLFLDLERLKKIASRAGRLQIVFAGKAHPQDQNGKEIIQRIFQMKELLKKEIKMVYLPNYDMALGKLITSGVDVWLNTPQPPMEASGTSGMKAALNGVPSLSILDGWWIEGWIEGVTGWSIGETARGGEKESDPAQDAASLYDKLEQIILPMFYRNQKSFLDVMVHAIALNGSFFNTQRMMSQYVLKAYFQ